MKPDKKPKSDEEIIELNDEIYTRNLDDQDKTAIELYRAGYEQGKLDQSFLAKSLGKNEMTAIIDVLESDWHTLKEKNPKIAREMLKHYVDMWNIPVSGYGNDEVIEMILDGRLSGINANGYWFASYEQQKPYYVASRLKSQISKNADEEANIEAYKQAENDEARRGGEVNDVSENPVKPEVQKVLDEFARENWGEARDWNGSMPSDRFEGFQSCKNEMERLATFAYTRGYEHKDFEQCKKSCPFVSQHKMEGKLDLVKLIDSKIETFYSEDNEGEFFMECSFLDWLKSQIKTEEVISRKENEERIHERIAGAQFNPLKKQGAKE